jgi:hypothetical protein
MFLSSKLKSANGALVASIGSLVGVYVILPAILLELFSGLSNNERLFDYLLFWHPAYALLRLLTNSPAADFNLPSWLYGWPVVALYAGLAAFFIRRTVKVLERRDQE